MLPTPSTSHVDINRIYEPAEDSYLFLDTLSSSSETQFLRQRFVATAGGHGHSSCPVVVEVGVGSGIVLAFVTAHAKVIFGREDLIVLGTDLNEHACRAAKQTVVKACRDTNISKHTAAVSPLCSILCADLTSSLKSGMADILVFNPPYVPSPNAPGAIMSMSLAPGAERTTDSFAYDSHLLSLSYAGGLGGMEVINKLLDEIPAVLNPKRGVAYILLCQQNKPDIVMQRIRGWGDRWESQIVGRSGKKAGWENLVILRIWRI